MNKHNLAVVGEFVSNDVGRKTLNNVAVTATETIATNGHYLVRVSKPVQGGEPVEGEAQELAGASFLLDGKAAVKIGKAMGKGGDAKVMPNGTGESFNIVLRDGTQFHAPKVDGQFPDVDVVMPAKDKAPAVKFGVSPSYLAKIAKAFAAFQAENKHAAVITVSVFDEQSPILFEAVNGDGQTMTALLMPKRLK